MTYRVMIPLKLYGADDALRQARQYERGGDAEAAAILREAAKAIRSGQLKPDRANEENVYLFGGGRYGP